MVTEKKDQFVADDGVSAVADPVTPEGGEDKVVDKKKKADKADKVDTATPGNKEVKVEETETDAEIVEEVVEIENSVASVFEGLDLSEEFKGKIELVFEAAVNEEVTNRVAKIEADLTEQLDTELNEAVEAKVESIIENLDSYLDYVVNEWVSENEVAIESGIKVEMAESLMSGLQDLFQSHNVEIDEETVDIVADLEEDYAELETKANNVLNENIELQKEIAAMKAEKTFEEISEGLTVSQKERLKVLSEKLNVENADNYAADLETLKESFFAESTSVQSDNVSDEENEILLDEETEVKAPVSDHGSINALVEALNARNSK